MPIVHNTNLSKTVIHSNQTKSSLELHPGINKVSDEDMKVFGEKIKAMSNLKLVQQIVDQVPSQAVDSEELKRLEEEEKKADQLLAELKAKEEAEAEAAAKLKAEEDAKEAEILAQIEKEELEKKSKSKKGG